MSVRCDVVVVGGGPAGLVTAALCARAGRSVTLFEKGDPAAFRVGETLGAEVGARLRELGAWEAMAPLLGEQAPFITVSAAWGGPDLDERSTMYHPLGAGWHVDRARFDLGLLEWARAEGVTVQTGTGLCAVTRAGGGFLVTPRHGTAAWGERLVDASGRGAPATVAFPERRWFSQDRQVAILARMKATAGADPGPGLYLEAVAEGFWYSAQMADGTFIAVLLTDSDVLVSLDKTKDERFASALSRTVHTALRVRGFELIGRPHVFRSDSGRLIPDRGPGWRAVGDAAMGTDPLGGAGVARSLKSALEAGADLDAPFDRARAEQRFSDYCDQRTEFYWMENRWPAAPFWARRRPVDGEGRPLYWKDVALTLAPDAMLAWAGATPPGAEAWLPRAALAVLRASLSQAPRVAHAAMAAMDAVAPIGHRRLLVGLQMLLSTGVLREV